jgi:diguanylate cyclase (GGDEF)-like protein
MDLPAQFSAKGIQAISCTIKDYCLGGVLIDVDKKLWKFNVNLVIGDKVTLHLKLPTKKSFQNFQLKARIARIIDNTAGLAFFEPDPAALQAMENYSNQIENKHSPKRVLKNDENVQRVQALIRRCVGDNITALLQRFFAEVDTGLIGAAAQAKSHMIQTNFSIAAQALKAKRGSIMTGFHKNVMQTMDLMLADMQPKPNDETSETQKLEIINKEVFESWLVSKIIITKAEADFSEQLLMLRLRLSKLLDCELDVEEIPISPAVFCNAFNEILTEFFAETYVEKIIYKIFENQFINNLGVLYDEINGILINSGILPEISLEEIAIAHRKIKEKNNQTTENGELPLEANNLSNAKTGSATTTTGGASTEKYNSAPVLSEKKILTADNDDNFSDVFVNRSKDQANHIRNRFNLQQKIARGAYKIANDLLTTHRENKAFNNKDTQIKEDETSSLFTSEQVLQVLDELQSELAKTGHGIDARKTIEYFNANRKAHLKERDVTLLNNIDLLFESMLVAVKNKDIAFNIEKLKLPISKLIYTDESFYESQIHPARLLINRIAEFDETDDIRTSKNLAELDRVISVLLSDYRRDAGVFDDALEEINKLLDIKKKIYRKNVNRVTESCNGQQKLLEAKSTCINTFRKFEQQNALPSVLFSLVDAGWKEVMMLSLLKPETNNWKECEDIIEKCVATYVGSVQQNIDILFHAILRRIDAVLVRSSHNEEAIKALRAQLEADDTTVTYVSVNDMIKRFVTDEEALRLDQSNEHAQSIWNKYPLLRKSLVRAQNIYVGNWIEQKDKEAKELRRLRLAWVNDDFTRYAFVNQQGIKNREFSLIDLVKALDSGEVKIIQDLDMPLVDKGLEGMVQDAYGKLKYQSVHDQLTGLVNRKEFDRLVNESVTDAKLQENVHAICCINLDQFKVINNACGLDAGDQLLKHIAGILLDSAPKDSVVARLGNDEYGVLIKNSNDSDAYHSLDNQIHLIENFRFNWEGKTFMVTASAGLAIINRKTASASAVIKAVNEACLSAKESGKNRIQVFNEYDNQLTERHDIMEWIGRLNRALDEDKLSLRGQKISSVTDPTKSSHYEVLLSVEDDDGVMLPPADFIQAAEKYNRMQAVDRWVIKNVFQWLHDNKPSLQDISGLAINLSGHSMNDSHMLEYIFDLFVKLEVPRDKVLFEVTETIAIANMEDAADFIREMRGIGCRFALDDFGSGLSSYAYLKYLPVDYVKIDGAFIRNIVTDKSDYAMVKSINEMVKFLGMKTIAEYVENEAILECLKEIGVDYAQGYGVGKPVPLHQILQRDDLSKTAALYY